jgi:hypothetical protein
MFAKLKRRLKNQYWVRYFLQKYHQHLANKYKSLNPKQIFTDIYQQKSWLQLDSVSGSGSDWAQTEVIRKELPILCQKYQIKTLLDLPCGDFNWLKTIDLPIENYIGADIVEDLIQQNQKNYANSKRQFLPLDIIQDKLPEADLILVRDCWVHLSNELIIKSLQNIKRSKIRYLLTTTFPDEKFNFDIQTGSWRPLNLGKKPFHFPPPLALIQEKSTESGGQYLDKSLALWRVTDL